MMDGLGIGAAAILQAVRLHRHWVTSRQYTVQLNLIQLSIFCLLVGSGTLVLLLFAKGKVGANILARRPFLLVASFTLFVLLSLLSIGGNLVIHRWRRRQTIFWSLIFSILGFESQTGMPAASFDYTGPSGILLLMAGSLLWNHHGRKWAPYIGRILRSLRRTSQPYDAPSVPASYLAYACEQLAYKFWRPPQTRTVEKGFVSYPGEVGHPLRSFETHYPSGQIGYNDQKESWLSPDSCSSNAWVYDKTHSGHNFENMQKHRPGCSYACPQLIVQGNIYLQGPVTIHYNANGAPPENRTKE